MAAVDAATTTAEVNSNHRQADKRAKSGRTRIWRPFVNQGEVGGISSSSGGSKNEEKQKQLLSANSENRKIGFYSVRDEIKLAAEQPPQIFFNRIWSAGFCNRQPLLCFFSLQYFKVCYERMNNVKC